MEVPNDTSLGHGLFTLHNPENDDIKTMRSILTKPAVLGAVYVSEPKRIKCFFLLAVDSNSNQAIEHFNDLAEYFDIDDLTVGTALDILYSKGRKRKLLKSNTRTVYRELRALAIQALGWQL
ncbi:hypothetical protein SEMRO_2974_G341300.1 [Seminavis robusta]|uniref:Uncharacterized protein n=1 Tax=Seminavis robusta TaxID=568900 RepID=A0A9N8F0L1_9STRA|nr:hypothetical protein SEMRO_2974_G341300.1 [Seminavis robusta]|eukprot:Sro2974_g341300.1 n/a (122) ;mRNA; f:5230-5595